MVTLASGKRCLTACAITCAALCRNFESSSSCFSIRHPPTRIQARSLVYWRIGAKGKNRCASRPRSPASVAGSLAVVLDEIDHHIVHSGHCPSSAARGTIAGVADSLLGGCVEPVIARGADDDRILDSTPPVHDHLQA